MSAEERWGEKYRYTEIRARGQPAVPVIKALDGSVRHARVTGSISKRDWRIDDEELPGYHGSEIVAAKLLRLGLRLVRSMAQPVADSTRCRRCKVRFSELEPDY